MYDDNNQPNPFDDAVQQTQQDNWNNNSYGDAYEVKTGPPPPPARPPTTQAQAQNSYDDNAYSAPDQNTQFGDPNDKPDKQFQSMELATEETSEADLKKTCNGYAPLPIYVWTVICCILLGFAGIFDLLTGGKRILQYVVNGYLFAIGCFMVMVELPSHLLVINKPIQERAYKWARFLRRAWGKSFFYMFIAFLTVTDQGDSAKTGCGVVVMLVAFLILFYAWQTARILKEIVMQTSEKIQQQYVAQSDYEDPNANQLALERYFAALTKNPQEKTLKREHILQMGKDCGWKLNSTEVQLIFHFFDDDSDGAISMVEFQYGMNRVLERHLRCCL